MNNDTLQNDRPEAVTSDLPELVINPPRTLTGFIVADGQEQNKRRAEALAQAYRFILSAAWGKK